MKNQKSKTETKKQALSRETLRTLAPAALKEVGGGYGYGAPRMTAQCLNPQPLPP